MRSAGLRKNEYWGNLHEEIWAAALQYAPAVRIHAVLHELYGLG